MPPVAARCVLLGAGVIHFAASGEHFDLSWMQGLFFTVVAWLQLAWAVGIVLRPMRRLLVAGIVLNARVVGFAGPNDLWHTHHQFCISRDTGLVLGAERISDQKCAAAGGENVGLQRNWMMHAWVVPGWENGWGIFSGEHPGLGGRNTLQLKG